jgi:hypothetical protein
MLIPLIIAYTISIALHYSGFLTAIPPPPPPPSPPPERPYKPTPDFQQSERLQEIIAQIRNHIAISASTRECFVIVSRRLDRMLADPTQRAHLSEDRVRIYFESTWPSFVVMNADLMKHKHLVHWGRTDKSPDAPLEIELNPDMVRELEAAQEARDNHVPYCSSVDTFIRGQICLYT